MLRAPPQKLLASGERPAASTGKKMLGKNGARRLTELRAPPPGTTGTRTLAVYISQATDPPLSVLHYDKVHQLASPRSCA